jgi:hypothetical protein
MRRGRGREREREGERERERSGETKNRKNKKSQGAKGETKNRSFIQWRSSKIFVPRPSAKQVSVSRSLPCLFNSLSL